MSIRHPPSSTVPLGTVLGRSEPLGRLMQRLRESNECFEALRPLLPPALLEQLRPGPLDDQGWSLLVANGAAAAKLRQMLPALEAALLARRGQVTPIRVKVLPRGA
jgi:hypothetical protein